MPAKRLVARTVLKNGTPGFTGRQGDLSASSGYTQAFGVAMALGFLGLDPDENRNQLDALGMPA